MSRVISAMCAGRSTGGTEDDAGSRGQDQKKRRHQTPPRVLFCSQQVPIPQ